MNGIPKGLISMKGYISWVGQGTRKIAGGKSV
jgi:hypothetical protein